MKISPELEQIKHHILLHAGSLSGEIAKKIAHHLDPFALTSLEKKIAQFAENRIKEAVLEIALFCEWGVFFQISDETKIVGFTKKIMEECNLNDHKTNLPPNYWIYLRLSPSPPVPTLLLKEESNNRIIKTNHLFYGTIQK